MYQIALCDDETTELNKTEQMLISYEKKNPEMKLIIRRFESADELLDTVREKNYMPDLILMDIYICLE